MSLSAIIDFDSFSAAVALSGIGIFALGMILPFKSLPSIAVNWKLNLCVTLLRSLLPLTVFLALIPPLTVMELLKVKESL